ncbi:histone-lysine N-methyltransferase PRDM9 isoform X3 [Magallana gigas]|uniref:histone-lysine N-methyltransferase PRDM9 isoform X3 n=1 Tax=Magallana gigas TaxID=29159 RepID=UPI00333FAB99
MTKDGFVVATGLLLALHLTGFLFEDTMKGECRLGFVRVDQWCFSFHTEPTSMLQSSDVCHQHGAHMAVLDSPEKEKALTDYIEQMGFFHIHQERKELYKIAKHESDVQAEKNKFCEDYKLHGTHSDKYRHIPNAKIPIGSPPHLRANLSTPPGFNIKLSNIPGAGLGAWTEQFLPEYTILGVYEGIIHTREPVFELYSWQVDRQGSNGTYVIDAADPACSNWLRFFNSPTTYTEENVIPVQCAGLVFYMTSRDVYPGTELLLWYGDGYGRFLGVNRIHPEYDLNGSVALRANVITYIDDKGLVFDDWTPVTYQNCFDNDDDEGETVLDQMFGLLLTYHHDNKWYWVAERNYTYYTGHEGLKLPFICEDSTNNSRVG